MTTMISILAGPLVQRQSVHGSPKTSSRSMTATLQCRAARFEGLPGPQLDEAAEPLMQVPKDSTTMGLMAEARDAPPTSESIFFDSMFKAALSKLPFRLGCTKTTELFLGRMAMFTLASSLAAEMATGQGPLTLLGLHAHVANLLEADRAILFLIGFNVVAAVLPAKGRFVPDRKQQAKAAVKKFLGIPEPGQCLTKANELALGRTAQLGLAASLVCEALTGKGALAQLEIETGVPMCDTDPLVIFFVALMLLAAISPGTGKFVEEK